MYHHAFQCLEYCEYHDEALAPLQYFRTCKRSYVTAKQFPEISVELNDSPPIEPQPAPCGMADRHRPRPWSIHEAEATGYEERLQLHRQEPSSDSYVEALDLADYTHELNTRSLTPLHDNYDDSTPISSQYISQYSISQPPLFVNSSSTPPTTARSSMSSTSHVLSLPPRLAPSFSSRTQLHLPQRTSRLSPTEDLSRPRAKHMDVLNTYPAFSRGWYAPSVVDVPTHEETPALPWNSPLGPLHSNQTVPVSDEVKEERMRMLEEEFGDKPLSAASGFEARSYSRGVDDHGNLIIYGKRKRIVARWLQGLLSFGAALSSLYAAFVSFRARIVVSLAQNLMVLVRDSSSIQLGHPRLRPKLPHISFTSSRPPHFSS